MTGKWMIGATVVRHRLTAAPRLSYVTAPRGRSGSSGGLAATRGILTALGLSAVIWAGLLSVIL